MSPPSEAVAHSSNTREHFEVKSQPSCVPSTCPLPLGDDFGYSKADLLHGLCAKAHPSARFRSESACLVGMRPRCGQKNKSPKPCGHSEGCLTVFTSYFFLLFFLFPLSSLAVIQPLPGTFFCVALSVGVKT